MRELPLTQGKVARVDDADYEDLSQHNWYAGRIRRRWYALRNGSRTLGPRRIVKMHHEVAGRPPDGLETDHVNGDGLDNRRANLRFVTHAQNMANALPLLGCSSRFKGVYWDKRDRRWVARIKSGGKSRRLGCFTNEKQAAHAYDAAAIAQWGEYARLNFRQEGEC